jgi:hypothetical protein
MMSRGVADDGRSDIELLCAMVLRHANGLENFPTCDDSMGALRRYIERINRDAGFMGQGLGCARSIGCRPQSRDIVSITLLTFSLVVGTRDFLEKVVDPYRVIESVGRETTGLS